MSIRRKLTLALILGVLPLAGGLGGCVGYGSYPGADEPIEGAEDPNQPNAERVMTTSLNYVLRRFRGSSNQAIAVNLPPGVRRAYYERIAASAASNAVPVTPEAVEQGLPVYHVGRIWLRHRMAKVDILRPRSEIGASPEGQGVYEGITVTLEGGFHPWRVVDIRTWEPGVVKVPDYWYLPATDRVDEFKRWRDERWPKAKPDRYEPETPAKLQEAPAASSPVVLPEGRPVTGESGASPTFRPPPAPQDSTPPPVEPAPEPSGAYWPEPADGPAPR